MTQWLAQPKFDGFSRPSLDQGVRINAGFYTGLLAELEAETLGADSALARIDEAFRLRTRSNIVARSLPASPARRNPAQARPRRSRSRRGSIPHRYRHREGARRAQSRSSGVACARQALQSTGRPADAHAVLAPALEGFSPTPEMPEIAEAQTLLEVWRGAAKKPFLRKAKRQRVDGGWPRL